MTREEWDAKQNASKKQFKYMSEGTPGQVKKVEVTEEEKETPPDNKTTEPVPVELKENWNKYLDWLEAKGMQGKQELDKGDLGNKLFKQYLKENPNSGLSEESIPLIRQGYIEMRNQGLEDIKTGKLGFAKGTNAENFMKHILINENTKHPNYVGQHLTQTRFPGAKLKEVDKKTGQVIRQVSATQRTSNPTNTLQSLNKTLQ